MITLIIKRLITIFCIPENLNLQNMVLSIIYASDNPTLTGCSLSWSKSIDVGIVLYAKTISPVL